jgi:hypothetical protein
VYKVIGRISAIDVNSGWAVAQVDAASSRGSTGDRLGLRARSDWPGSRPRSCGARPCRRRRQRGRDLSLSRWPEVGAGQLGGHRLASDAITWVFNPTYVPFVLVPVGALSSSCWVDLTWRSAYGTMVRGRDIPSMRATGPPGCRMAIKRDGGIRPGCGSTHPPLLATRCTRSRRSAASSRSSGRPLMAICTLPEQDLTLPLGETRQWAYGQRQLMERQPAAALGRAGPGLRGTRAGTRCPSPTGFGGRWRPRRLGRVEGLIAARAGGWCGLIGGLPTRSSIHDAETLCTSYRCASFQWAHLKSSAAASVVLGQ